jgi:hypothetical protein
MSGAVEVVKKAVNEVGNAVESAGELASDTLDSAVKVTKEAGSWIDDTIIQPALDDPIKTAITIAAVAYAGPAAATYFNTSALVGSAIAAGTTAAATTLASGGDFEDALKSGATSAGAVYAGGTVGGEVAGQTGSKAAGNVARGATAGAVGAAASGGDAAQGFLTGALLSGVNEAVEGASTAVKDSTGVGQGTNISLVGELKPAKSGIGLDADSSSSFGLTTSPREQGIAMPQSDAVTSTPYADYSQYSRDLGIGGGQSNTGIDFSKTGETGIKTDSTGFGINTGSSPEPAFDTVEPTTKGPESTSQESAIEKTIKNIAKQSLTDLLLGGDSMDGGDYVYRPGEITPVKTSELTGTTDVALKQVALDESELRKFSNNAGQTTLIPFRNQKPQAPIPVGYTEVGVIGKAEGGLIDKPSTTMVKYSKKPLVAPRKQVQKPKKNKIAGKGLAVKKT